LKIAIVHNTYQQPGGEDVVVAAEAALLERSGHKVIRYSRSNDEIQSMSRSEHLLMVKDIIYSERSKQELFEMLKTERPDLVHVHNTFMRISPSIFDACREAHIPALQTLHNYRLLCPGWTLARSGSVCEECLDHGLWRGVWHGCYRNSRFMTAAVALMLQTHRAKHTWDRSVDGFVALTDFARSKFIQGGLPGPAIYVKPNFMDRDPGERTSPGTSMLFVGRLSAEKGVHVLVRSWGKLSSYIPLLIVGDGPMRQELEAETASKKLNITFAGWRSREEIIAAMKSAFALLLPSVCYEGFPMTLVEAFACGTPAICSGFGGMAEIVADGRTGLHFRPGDETDFAEKVELAWSRPQVLAEMGRAARREYELNYTAETNYRLLMQIYEKTIERAARN